MFHWLITGKSVDVTTCVDLVWVAYTVKKLLRLAYKFDLDQSERKSSRKSTLVHARLGQTESQVDPSFNLRPLATPFGLGLNEFWRPIKSLSSAVVVNSDPLGRDLFCWKRHPLLLLLEIGKIPTNLWNEGQCPSSNVMPAIFATSAYRKAAVGRCHKRLFLQQLGDSLHKVPSLLWTQCSTKRRSTNR